GGRVCRRVHGSRFAARHAGGRSRARRSARKSGTMAGHAGARRPGTLEAHCRSRMRIQTLFICCVALVLVAACTPAQKRVARTGSEGVLKLSLVAERLVVPVDLGSTSASQSV